MIARNSSGRFSTPKRIPRICECGDHAWVPVTLGFVALVSPEDIGLLELGNWSTARRGKVIYAQREINGKKPYLHRAILNTSAPDIDHINHNGLDNRRSNIRPCTRAQNVGNSRSRGGTSRFRGVFRSADSGRWTAQICLNGKRTHIGMFDTEEAAAEARRAAAQAIYGEFTNV